MNNFKKLLVILLVVSSIKPVFSTIYINEISGNDKWLEIYNSNESEVDLTGYKIRKIDEDGIPADWSIPSGTKIPAGGFLSWERNKDCTDGSTFTWGISAKKDVAFKIINSSNVEEDHFVVGSNLYSDGLSRTVGRETDGAENLVIFLNGGTRNASNNNGDKQSATENPMKIFVNEMNGNDNDYYDIDQHKWLEIYNDEDQEVDLANYSIRKIDEKGSINNWFFPSGVKIAAKGFLVLEQDSLCTDGSTFTWGISAKKDVTFKIFDDNGTELDSFEVQADEGDPLYSSGDGRTVGRKYDGSEMLVVFNHSNVTKGTSNGTPPSSILQNAANESNVFVKAKILYLYGEITELAVYNIAGNKVLSQNVTNQSEIDLSAFPVGVYLVKIKGNSNEGVQKILLKD